METFSFQESFDFSLSKTLYLLNKNFYQKRPKYSERFLPFDNSAVDSFCALSAGSKLVIIGSSTLCLILAIVVVIIVACVVFENAITDKSCINRIYELVV